VNKWQIICPLVALAIAVVVAAVISGANHQRTLQAAYIRQVKTIGHDLVSTTNSTQLVPLTDEQRTALSAFLSSTAQVERVARGGGPTGFELVLTNHLAGRLRLDLVRDAKSGKFQVVQVLRDEK
jgi:hypothetical protein